MKEQKELRILLISSLFPHRWRSWGPSYAESDTSVWWYQSMYTLYEYGLWAHAIWTWVPAPPCISLINIQVTHSPPLFTKHLPNNYPDPGTVWGSYTPKTPKRLLSLRVCKWRNSLQRISKFPQREDNRVSSQPQAVWFQSPCILHHLIGCTKLWQIIILPHECGKTKLR